MEYNLLIDLKSDLCASSGDSFGSLIDNDICFDNFGFPYIPAKRLKGILREEAEEYCQWFDGEDRNKINEYIKEIFGVEGSQNSGALKIDNAYIEQYKEKVAELQNVDDKYKKYLTPQRILNIYTYLRMQTAIDPKTGTSKKESLRNIRVIKRKNRFIATVEINAEEGAINFLKDIVRLTTHMGLNRTRGYGEIRCRMFTDEELQKYPEIGTEYVLANLIGKEKSEEIRLQANDEEEVSLKILLKSESELMLSKQNAEDSESYIPGSNILGSIAKKYLEVNPIDFNNITDEYINLFLNGKVIYTNAYITNEEGKQFYPIPFSYAKVKNTNDRFYNKMFDVEEDGIQLTAITNKFVTFDENSYIKDVEMSENYHHQRAKDNKIGRTLQSENGGTLYQYNVIGANQYFLATITGKAKYLRKILPYIKINDVLRVGKSKNTEYGKIRIKEIKEVKDRLELKEYNKFAVILTSDVILLDNGKPTTNKEKMVGKIKNILGQNIKLERAFINYTTVSGYNIIWNLPKEQQEAFKAGSVLVFNAEEPIKAKEEYVIGQRKAEGYGRIKIMDISNKTAELNLKESKHIKKEEADLPYGILQKAIQDAIMDEIVAKAIENIEKVDYKINNSTIGRLMLMLEQSNTFAEFKENYNSIKDINKLRLVKEFLDNIPKEFEEFSTVKDLIELKQNMNLELHQEEKEKYILEYAKQSLVQIKLKGEK